MADQDEAKASKPEPDAQGGEDEASTEKEGHDDHLHEDQKSSTI